MDDQNVTAGLDRGYNCEKQKQGVLRVREGGIKATMHVLWVGDRCTEQKHVYRNVQGRSKFSSSRQKKRNWILPSSTIFFLFRPSKNGWGLLPSEEQSAFAQCVTQIPASSRDTFTDHCVTFPGKTNMYSLQMGTNNRPKKWFHPSLVL